jgi:hypothetical protein
MPHLLNDTRSVISGRIRGLVFLVFLIQKTRIVLRQIELDHHLRNIPLVVFLEQSLLLLLVEQPAFHGFLNHFFQIYFVLKVHLNDD